jgi:hypothetical protein
MKRNVLILALIMFVSTAFAATSATNTGVTFNQAFEQVETSTKLNLKERIDLKIAKKA